MGFHFVGRLSKRKANGTKQPIKRRSRRLLLEILEDRTAPSASWANLAASGTAPPDGGAMMMLLSDGSILVQDGINPTTSAGQNTFRLSPQANTGSYVNGAWSPTTGNMNENRLFFTTAMLPDGRVFAVGGEYPKFSNTAEIYDPATGLWTSVDSVPTPATNVDLNGVVTGASNTAPITITTASTNQLQNGMQVTVSGVTGNTAANGTWTVTGRTSTTFQLVGSDGTMSGAFVNDGNGTWSAFVSQYGDDPIEVLPNGQVLAGYFNSPTTYRFNPAATPGSQWTTTTNGKLHNDRSDEESWVKLPDNSILSYDVFASKGGTFQGQRYVPSSDSWVNASTLGSPAPTRLTDPTTGMPPLFQGQGSELGPGFLLPDGRVFFFGANGNTAYFTPTNGDYSTGKWTAGPQEPMKGGVLQVATDDPGAVLPNGHILITLSPLGGIPANAMGKPTSYNFPTPSYVYDYDPVAQTFTDVSPGGALGGTTLTPNAFALNMVLLPTGQVLLAQEGGPFQVFTEDPATGPQDAWRPTITGITDNHDNTFTLRGTQLNGLSEGAAYGDDNAMASNYPIIRFVDSGGNDFYGRTFNWSSTGVATGSTPESALFTLPSGHMLSDFTSITVIANGIPSLPTTLVALGSMDENVTIRVDPLDSTMVQVLVTGTTTVVATAPNNSPNPIAIVGDANNNAVTIDESFGVVNTPILFDGGGSSGVPGDQMIVIGTSADDTLNLTPSGATSADMTFDGSRVYSFSNIQQFSFNGEDGNDTMTVDSSTSLLSLANGVKYDGGTGFNSLKLVQTGGTTRTIDVYSPGPNPGQGTDVIDNQNVFFQNLAPVLDTVPATTLIVNGTPANNAINYAPGFLDPVNDGLITVDNFESMEFSQKTNLIIAGMAGSDEINLNNPGTPTNLTSITVNAGDPTASDSLIVNGTAATVTVAEATSTITGAGPVPISYAAIESLTVVNAGTSTTLAVTGSTNYTFNPGADIASGTIVTDASYPIIFHGYISGETIALTGSVPGANLIVNGTAADDRFSVDGTTGNIMLSAPDGSQNRATIAPSSIGNLTLNGLDGNDTANLTGNGSDVTANLGGSAASVTGGGLGTVSLPGIEVLNLSAGAGNITLAGTSGPDAFTVTPTGANTATAQVDGLSPVVNTTNTATLTVDAGAGSNALTVNGTSAADTINVSGAAVTVVGLKTVNYTNVESLQVNGLAGSDTFNVTSSATVPISIDGGDPVGVTPGDLLNVVTSPGDSVAFTPGPTSDSGGFVVNANAPISFVHIESLSVSGGGTPVIFGTNGNDVITVIARDNSYAAGADGVQDFTVSVNAGPTFLFINVPALTIDALGGDDLVDLVTPAPNGADWHVNVTIDGGPPSASDHLIVETPGFNAVSYTPTSPNSGTLVINGAVNNTNVNIIDIEQFTYNGMGGNDVLTMIGNSGANVFTLTPGANPDAGTLGMDTTLPVAFVNLGATGKVIVNGNGGADSLVYYGTPVNDTFSIDNNASPAGGKVTLNARVPVITTAIATLTLEGLAGDDTFNLVPTIAASPYTTLNLHGGGQASAAGDQANLTAAAAADVTVSGQVVSQSGKTVAGTGLENINLNGAPAGNRLIYNGVVGVTENINVIASPTANQGQVSVPGVTHVTFTNVPALVVNGNPADSDTLTFTGTNNSDTFNVNLAAAGTAAAPVLKLQSTATASLLLTLQNYTGFTTLNVAGLDGADTFNVFTAPTAPSDPNLPGGRNVFINGTLPTGKKKGTDVLHVFYISPRPKIVQTVATQNPTAGQIKLDYGTALYLVGFAGIENVTIQKQ
jgi:hypothetical protein